MRRFLAPLTSWLDRRIDARIAAYHEAREQEARAFLEEIARSRRGSGSSAGLAELTAEAARDIREASELLDEAAASRGGNWMGA